MAIQNRRGPSAKFDPSKLLPGEWAVKLDTKEIYMCYAAGDVRRMATYEEMVENINEATKDVQDMFTEEVRAAIQAATTAEYQANMAATSANSAATSARNAAESANTSANNANAAALNANNAADAVADVMANVWESMDIIAGIGLVWYLYTTGDPGRIEQVSANEYCENSVMEVSPGEKYRITIHNDASSGGSSYTSAPNIMVATAETGGYRIVDSYVGSYQNQVVTIPESAEQLYLLLYSTGRNLGGISRVEKYMISEYAKTEADANKAIQNANAVAQEIIGKVEQIDQNTQRIDELKGDIAKNVLSDKVLKRRVDAIWKLNEGISYRFETNFDAGYRKDIPSGAKLASVKQIGGKTIVWNQIIKQNAFPIVAERNGITVENNGDGSITINGTATGDALINSALKNEVKCDHKYIILGDSGDCCFNVYDSTAIGGYGIDAPYIFTSKATKELTLERIYVKQGVSANNVKIYPMLIDLTLMFGAGNEPSSVEEIKSMFPDDYYPYDAGTLMSAPVNEIVSEDNSGNVLQSAQVPDAVLNLDGYGDSAGDVYNYVDWEKKQYVQRVGKVVLDSFTSAWGSVTHGDAVYWTGGNFDHNVKMISNNFVYSNLSVAAAPVYSFGFESGAGVTKYFILPSTITSLQEANEWLKLNETIIYYELAEPVIIDISDLIPEDFNPIEVEAGGSLTFKNSNGESYRVPIPNEVEYAVKLSEVV